MLAALFGSWPRYLGASLLLLVAELVYVLFGFGAGLVAVGPLALLLPRVSDGVVLLLLVNVPVELAVVLVARRLVAWRGVAAICAGIAVGTPLGALALGRGDPRLILVALALLLLVIGLALLLVPGQARVTWPRWAALVAGLLCGVLSGMFGTGGPPVILFYRLAGLDKSSFRGQLMTIFLFVTLVRLASYVPLGLVPAARLGQAALLMPAVVLGALLGQRIHVKLDELTFQRLVAVALLLIGAALLLRG